MAKNDPTTKLPDTHALAELELANASLAERVGELEAELAQRDETIAQLTAQTARDGEAARSRVHGLQMKLTEAEGQRDAARDGALREVEAGRREIQGLLHEVEGLQHELVRRSTARAPLAFDITALLDLHRIVGSDSDRYLATARRLGDALVAEHAEASARR
ncbi:MAG: hypothetical protein EPO40_19595 [Myxococcaceae bacterium]|nr:MAG: hypothetical protein EPO40_19595 [Myxococcaceae bacterium]